MTNILSHVKINFALTDQRYFEDIVWTIDLCNLPLENLMSWDSGDNALSIVHMVIESTLNDDPSMFSIGGPHRRCVCVCVQYPSGIFQVLGAFPVCVCWCNGERAPGKEQEL